MAKDTETVEAEDTLEETQEAEQQQGEADKKAERDESGRFKSTEKAETGDTEPAKEEPVDWRSLLRSEDARKAAKEFNSLDEVFQRSADLRKEISDRIKRPDKLKDADEKEVAKFRKALGVPEKPEGYELKLPEGMELNEAEEQLVEALKPVAHEQNLPKAAFEGFVAKFKEFEEQIVNEHHAAMEKQREESEAELRKEWGRDFDGNVNVANRAMKQFAGDEMVEFLNSTELKDGGVLGNHPAMVRLFAKLGRQMSEDGVIQPVDQEEAKNLQQKMEDLTSKIHAAHQKGDRMTVQKLSNERTEIAERLYGDAPIVGGGGRTA